MVFCSHQLSRTSLSSTASTEIKRWKYENWRCFLVAFSWT